MHKRYTNSAQKAIENAKKEALSLGHHNVGTEHILLALLATKGVAGEVLKENGVSYDKMLELVEDYLSASGEVAVVDKEEMTPRAAKVLQNGLAEADRLGAASAGTEHLLVAMLKEADCIAVRLLNTKGINIQTLYVDVLTAAGQDATSAKNEYMMQKGRKQKSATPMLDQYSRDLTAFAKDGKLDPVIGRETEIRRLVQVLSRRTTA